MELYKILYLLLPLFVILHITEEFIYPGGFTALDRIYRPEISKNVNPRYLIFINILLVAFSLIPVFSGLTPGGVIWWLCASSILFVNSYFHIKGTIKLKRYFPGVITSVLLHTPLTILGYWYFLKNADVTWRTAIFCSLSGIVFHLFSAYTPMRNTDNNG